MGCGKWWIFLPTSFVCRQKRRLGAVRPTRLQFYLVYLEVHSTNKNATQSPQVNSLSAQMTLPPANIQHDSTKNSGICCKHGSHLHEDLNVLAAIANLKRICEPQPGGSQHIYFFILSSFWLSFILHYHYHLFIIFKFIIIFFYHLQIHCHFASASVVCLAIIFYMLKILYTTTYYCLYLYDKK